MGKLTFGTTGLSYQCDKVEVKVDGAPKCPRCQERVYFNEEKKALGKTWHRKCFSCSKCDKKLESTNYNQNNDQVLCTACFRKTCGPHVYGFVPGANLPTTVDFDQADRLSFSRRSSSCSSPSFDGNSLLPPSQTIGGRRASGAVSNPDHPECCPRCGDRVFFAEEVKALKRKWHRQCFKCQSCSKTLEPGKCSEHERRIYCQSCYGRQFGPRGYGYAGGSATLLLSEVPSPRPLTPRDSQGTSSTHQLSVDYAQTSSFNYPTYRSNGSDSESYEVFPREPETFDQMEPIKGTQEWTEAVFNPSPVPRSPLRHYPLPPLAANGAEEQYYLQAPAFNGHRGC